jgi:hypothetical protein
VEAVAELPEAMVGAEAAGAGAHAIADSVGKEGAVTGDIAGATFLTAAGCVSGEGVLALTFA